MENKSAYSWRFKSIGGSSRVDISKGEDIKHLGELDQKLWTVLSCPATGLEFDQKTLDAIDTDKDGKIRVNEILAASSWLTKVIKDADLLLKGDDVLPLSRSVEGGSVTERHVLFALVDAIMKRYPRRKY